MPYIGKAPSSGIRSRFIYTATAAQTTFTGADGNGKTLGYTDGEYVDVYLNGVLLDPADYTATSKTSVVLDSGATVSDIVEIVVYDTFSVFNGTFTGDLTVDGDTLVVDSTNNNVYVGKTSAGTGTAGVQMKSDGETAITRSGTPFIVNRLSSDGTITQFRKDGTTVGSIGSRSGGGINVNSQTGSLGLQVAGANTMFVGSSELFGGTDATIDLGITSNRFKDLYLSGSVYLGGTGSANALDDYEEGTWTPSIGTGTVNAQAARYVKIGQQVTVWGYLQTFSDRSTASAINISGLPFTSASDNFASGATLHRYINANGDMVTAYIPQSTTTMTFYSSLKNAEYVNVLHSHLSSTSSVIFFTISYRA